MMTSSNGNIFSITGHLCGEFTSPRWNPRTKPVTRSFDVFFHLRLNKWLSKQSWGWWFETLSCPLWRHCNVYIGYALHIFNPPLHLSTTIRLSWFMIFKHIGLLNHPLACHVRACLQSYFSRLLQFVSPIISSRPNFVQKKHDSAKCDAKCVTSLS